MKNWIELTNAYNQPIWVNITTIVAVNTKRTSGSTRLVNTSGDDLVVNDDASEVMKKIQQNETDNMTR